MVNNFILANAKISANAAPDYARVEQMRSGKPKFNTVSGPAHIVFHINSTRLD